MAHIERLRWYPIKGFDGVSAETVRVTAAGTIAGDRAYAMCDPSADRITASEIQTLAYNGKQTTRIHDVRMAFDADSHALTVDPKDGGESRTFDLSTDAGLAAADRSRIHGLDGRPSCRCLTYPFN